MKNAKILEQLRRPSGELTTTIEGLATTGDGIAHINDKKVFIPLTAPGDKVKISIQKDTRRFIKAELLEVLEKGSDRIQPPCKYFGKCGGCSLQHISEKSYYELKEKMLHQAISQVRLDTNKITDVIKIGEKSRRRAIFKVDSNGNLSFSERDGNNLVAVDSCLIIETELEQLILPIQKFINTLPTGMVTEVALSLADNGVDCIMTLSRNPELEELGLFTNFAKNNDSIISLSYKFQWKIFPIHIKKIPQLIFGDIKIDLPSGIFLQATRKGQEAITHEVLQATQDAKHVLDLYSGIGTYTFPIAKNSKVTAMEGDEAMITSLRKNAVTNGLATQIQAEYRDLVNGPVRLDEIKKYKYDAVVINPPRNGAKAQAEILAKSNIPTIVMVSCNPLTFSQDAKILVDGGYKLEKVIGIDQFYWSEHLEVVAVLSKK